MAGILPSNGVPPGQTQNGINAPNLAPGCSNLYYGPRCNPRLDPFAMNAMISEFINAVNSLGISYNCNRLDNLSTAFSILQQAPPVEFQSGAPQAILEYIQNSGVDGGLLPALNQWFQYPLNAKPYDPGGLITFSGNGVFTPSVNGYVDWFAMSVDAGNCQTRIWNITDGIGQGLGSSEITFATTGAGSSTSVKSFGSGHIYAGKAYRIEMTCSRTTENRPYRLGDARGAGEFEIYGRLRFWRTA